jgi:hypothetical protein
MQPVSTETDPFPPDVLVVESRARWFRPPPRGRVELRRQRRLQLRLFTLAKARLAAAADQGVSVDDLFRSAWPEQRVFRTAMVNRVKVAVATLRKLGLDGVLITQDGGYLIRVTWLIGLTLAPAG